MRASKPPAPSAWRCLTDLFKLAELAAGRGSTIAVRELLNRGSHRIAMELGDDPETQVALFNAIARVYGNLGLHDAAIEVLERALGRERAASGEGTLRQAATLHLLGERHASKNDFAPAERRFAKRLRCAAGWVRRRSKWRRHSKGSGER